MKINLDLKNFKHLKSDENSTTLKHKDSHLLTIAHKSLSPEMRTQLEVLAKASEPKENFDEGGKVPIPDSQQSPSTNTQDRAKQMSEGAQKSQADVSGSELIDRLKNAWADGGKIKEGLADYNKREEVKSEQNPTTLDYKQLHKEKRAMNIKESNAPVMPNGKRKGYDEGGQVTAIHSDKDEPGYTEKPKMAQGGPIDTYGMGLPCLNPNCKSHGKPHPNCRCYSGMAEGGEAVHYCRTGAHHARGCEYYKEGGKVQSDDSMPGKDLEAIEDEAPKHMDPKAVKESQNTEQDPEDFSKELAATEVPPPSNEMPQAQMPSEASTANLNAEPAATPEIYGQPLEANDPSLAQNQPYQPTHTDFPKDDASQVFTAPAEMAEYQKFKQDMLNGHITPKTYHDLWAEKSTPGKILTLIGALAGGFSGLAHQSNPVFANMDKIIANDLEAQKQSKSNAMTHWNMNYQHALEQAQAAGLDANSDKVREEIKPIATARTRTQQNAIAYATALNFAKNLAEPARTKFLNAAALVERNADQHSANRFSQMAAEMQLQNPNKAQQLNPVGAATQPQAPNQDAFQKLKSKTQEYNQKAAPTHMAPDDARWNDKDLKPWHSAPGEEPQVPKTNPIPFVHVNNEEINRQRYLGGQKNPPPGVMTPDEFDKADKEAAQAGELNQTMQQIHDHFGTMWKNAGPTNDAILHMKGQNIMGVHLPDMSNWNDSSRRYGAAAAQVSQLLGNLASRGSGHDIFGMVEKEMPTYKDTPTDYRRKLEAIDNRLRTISVGGATTLKRRNLATGLP